MTFPKNWEKTKMGDIGRYLNGKAFKSEEWKSTGRPIIRIQNLTGSGSEYNYFQGEVEDRYVVMPGDLLFSWSATLGTYIWQGPEAVLNQHIFKVESYIDKKFHRYLLDFKIQEMQSQTHGSGMVHITKKSFDAIEVHIPLIDQQHKIVELLEDHLSRLDAALIDVKQAKIKAAQFRRSLLQAAFIGYLNDESFTIGSEIPPLWRKISLGNVLEPRKQKDIPSTFPNLPYIGMEHVARDVGLINSFGSSANYRSAAPRVYKGDVLYGRLRPYLNKVAISPCEAFASGEFIVLPPNEKISGKFLQLRLLSQDFVEFAGTLDTGDRPRVSWEQIARFELALPPINEQIKMISSLEDQLLRLDASVSLADAMEKQSNALRRSLLQAAFTGQLIKEVVSV